MKYEQARSPKLSRGVGGRGHGAGEVRAARAITGGRSDELNPPWSFSTREARASTWKPAYAAAAAEAAGGGRRAAAGRGEY